MFVAKHEPLPAEQRRTSGSRQATRLAPAPPFKLLRRLTSKMLSLISTQHGSSHSVRLPAWLM
jgi:hypothetical protein